MHSATLCSVTELHCKPTTSLAPAMGPKRPSIRDTDPPKIIMGLKHYIECLSLGEGAFDLGPYSRALKSPSGAGLVHNFRMLSGILPHLDHGLVRCWPLQPLRSFSLSSHQELSLLV